MNNPFDLCTALELAEITSGHAKLDAGIDPKADLMRELRLRWQP